MSFNKSFKFIIVNFKTYRLGDIGILTSRYLYFDGRLITFCILELVNYKLIYSKSYRLWVIMALCTLYSA